LAKNDDALSIPGDAPDINRWAEFFYRSRRDLNSFEFAWCWEGQVAAIGRPGNTICPLRAVESPCGRSVQRPQPYSRRVVGFSDEGGCQSVRRQRMGSRKRRKCETRTFRRRYGEAVAPLDGRSPVPEFQEPARSSTDGQESEEGCEPPAQP